MQISWNMKNLFKFKFKNSLNLNTWPFWFEISYEFLLKMIIFDIVENLILDKPVWTE